MKGKTKTGFEFDIPDENFDMEFIDTLAELDESNPVKMSKLITLLFDGTDGKAKLYDHVRTEAGKVPTDAVAQEVTDIFNAIPKNS